METVSDIKKRNYRRRRLRISTRERRTPLFASEAAKMGKNGF